MRALATRALPMATWRTYAMTAGMIGPTFMIFSSVESFAALDGLMAEGMAAESKMTAEERALLQRFGREALISAETHRFALNASMSYVSAEVRAMDPKFWMKK